MTGRAKAAHAEQRGCRQPADCGGRIASAVREHPELDRRPDGRTARDDEGDRVARQQGRGDGKPVPGPQRQPLEGDSAREVRELGRDRGEDPPRVQGRQARPGREHFGDDREHEIEGDASHDHRGGALQQRFPRQRL